MHFYIYAYYIFIIMPIIYNIYALIMSSHLGENLNMQQKD